MQYAGLFNMKAGPFLNGGYLCAMRAKLATPSGREELVKEVIELIDECVSRRNAIESYLLAIEPKHVNYRNYSALSHLNVISVPRKRADRLDPGPTNDALTGRFPSPSGLEVSHLKTGGLQHDKP